MFGRDKPKNRSEKDDKDKKNKTELKEKVTVGYKRNGKPTIIRDVDPDDLDKLVKALNEGKDKITNLRTVNQNPPK